MPGQAAGSLNVLGYVHIKIYGREYKRGRLAWLYIHGEWPHPCIDHINRIRNDDRLLNLRVATLSENCQNRSQNNKTQTGILGVTKHGDKFVARIQKNKNPIYLGCFENIEDAKIARQQAEIKYHGQFASKST